MPEVLSDLFDEPITSQNYQKSSLVTLTDLAIDKLPVVLFGDFDKPD